MSVTESLQSLQADFQIITKQNHKSWVNNALFLDQELCPEIARILVTGVIPW